MSKPTPLFRSIGEPLNVSDDALNKVVDKLGVPSLVKPDASPAHVSKAVPIAPSSPTRSEIQELAQAHLPASETAPVLLERISVDLPTYLGKAMRMRVAEEGTTMRFLVMQGLQAIGFPIEPRDFVSDGRSTRGKVR